MRIVRCLVAGLLAFAVAAGSCRAESVITSADDQGPAQTASTPAGGKGRIVMVLSGRNGPVGLEPVTDALVKLGYYTVLLDGNDILRDDLGDRGQLPLAIRRAQKSDKALPGKAAVIGFSQGGGGALAYATRLPDLVAVVIAYYPKTDFIEAYGGYDKFVGGFRVPTLILAGGADTFYNCCRIATMRQIEATARKLGAPVDLVVYPDAYHGFNLGSHYRPADAADAWARVTTLLREYLGDGTQRPGNR
jgi:dipeptidyl aminopeptidase/acylaminoacyl peptidase